MEPRRLGDRPFIAWQDHRPRLRLRSAQDAPDPGDKTVLYIDQMELQTVVPDHVEGWDVSPGKIAFSHAGYVSGSSKTAIAQAPARP